MKECFQINFLAVVLSASILITVSCTKELTPPPDDKADNSGIPFSLSSARDFFNGNATDIRFVDFSKETTDNNGDGTDTRGYIPSGEQIVPAWDKASVYIDSTKVIHEIPLDNIGIDGALVLNRSKELVDTSEELKVMSYLVVVKSLLSETTIMFVCTTFGTYNEDDNGETASYVRYNPGFSGYMIFSDVSGLYLASYMYENGRGDWAIMRNLSKKETPEEFTGFLFIEENGNNPAFANTRGGILQDSIYEFEEVVVVAQRRQQTVPPPEAWSPIDWEVLMGGGGGSNAPAGNGGGSPNAPSAKINDVMYSLELRVSGIGTVSPAGISTYPGGNSAYITATPSSLTVFGGWFENGGLIGNNYNHSIIMTANRCITGVFYPFDDPCGELARKYRTNTQMNNNINNVLRKTLRQRNPAVEHAYLVTNSNIREDQPPGGEDHVQVSLNANTIYVEITHLHPSEVPTPSSGDLLLMYRACNENRVISGVVFNIVTQTEVLSIEIANLSKFKAFALGRFDTQENIDGHFSKKYRDEIIQVDNPDYKTNSTDRAIQWLSDNDAGLKFARAKTENGENNWVATKFDENGELSYINCNGR